MRPSVSVEQDRREQIVRAALLQVATQGVSGTSLRTIAATCGVSLGLVQHYFRTKAALMSAVDEHVLVHLSDVLGTSSQGVREKQPDEVARQFALLLVKQPEVVDYLARALCDGEPIGAAVFDRLVAVSSAPAESLDEQCTGAEGLDPAWAAINPLILMLGTIMFRGHIERHLRLNLNDRDNVTDWGDAFTSLMRRGYFHQQAG